MADVADSLCRSWLPLHGGRSKAVGRYDSEPSINDLGWLADRDPTDAAFQSLDQSQAVGSLPPSKAEWAILQDYIWLSKFTDSPEVVLNYLTQHGIKDGVMQTVDIVQKTYPSGSKVSLSLEGDGESDEEWLVVHVAANAAWDEAFNIYDQLVDSWIKSVPMPTQHRIHITYSAR